ncbi:MAG TPA: HEAT repeat domain-containing protein [Terriglobales bacterium]|nr:HEAT repeat domain-containing protein [Terriglobales bacterium]
MSDNKQIKALGLRFARGLQMTVKTTIMFTVVHKSVERPIQQSFELLNTLLKEVGQFTFGFVDNQVMLNNVLTNDVSLRHLEAEFLKRGITAVTFEPGLTLGRYRKLVTLLAASPKVIEDAGGTLNFLDKNEIEGARILPASKNQKKDEQGDTIIDTDSEAYILSKQMASEQGSRDFLDSIDSLLESGCFDPAVRNDVLSEFATQQFDGAGYGVPIGMPNLVPLREGQIVVDASAVTGSGAEPGQLGNGPAFSGGQGGPGGYVSGQESGEPGAQNAGEGTRATKSQGRRVVKHVPVATTGQPNSGSYYYADGSGPIGEAGLPNPLDVGPSPSAWRNAHGLPTSGSGTFMEMVEASVQRSLLEERGNPQKSYASLARILRNTGVDKILENFPAERRQELTSLPPEKLAAEYIEDTALQLAGQRLQSAEGQPQKLLIEEGAIRVLARSLQATQMADRLAQKLAKFITDFSVPQHLQEKIREELQWSTLSGSKRFARLMEIRRYSSTEFRRVIDLARELIKTREMDRAAALATHYFDFLDDGGEFDVTELSRAPELIRSIPLAQAGFASKTTERLGKTLMREDLSQFIHAQAATALTVLAQSVASYEDFQDVLAIGMLLESSLNRDPEKHKKCCGNNLGRLLPAAAVERIIEMFLLQRGDSVWGKSSATLLRFAAPGSVESVFNHLIHERDARNRLALIRLIGQLGTASIEVAYKYLKDERWYVVRNICGVLAELKDPDLADHIVPALEHHDPRVQQAALKALVRSRTVRAAPVMANSLLKLAPNILDEALDELMFLRHVKTVDGLEAFICGAGTNQAASKKAIQVLNAIDVEEALEALAMILRNETVDIVVRRAALQALSNNRSEEAVALLQEFAKTHGQLAQEAGLALKKAAGAK